MTRFANIFADKFIVDKQKMMEKLWGDNYFDSEKKTWTTSEISETGKVLKRNFVQFIMEPIIKLARSIIEGNVEQMEKMMIAVKV